MRTFKGCHTAVAPQRQASPFAGETPDSIGSRMLGGQHSGQLLGIAVSLAAAAGIAFGGLGGVHRWLELLSPFRLHFAVFCGAGVLAAVFAGRAWPILLASGPAAVLLPVALAYWPVQAASVAPLATGAERALKVLSFNTWDEVRNEGEIVRLLEQERPDIAILVETPRYKRRILETLRKTLPYQASCIEQHWCNIAILSRFPIGPSGGAASNGWRPPHLWARIDVEGTPVTVVGTHIFRPTRSARYHRSNLEWLSEFVRGVDGAVIVGGDFNGPAWGDAFRKMRESTGLHAMPRVLPSWPARPLPLPQVALDHILVSRPLAFRSVRLGDSSGSDHFPIVAEIALPAVGDHGGGDKHSSVR
jgi:endonuclease/exonuclease/phosphatase (EEP) superfamily protein YafD